jgi:hypothetical protein
MKIRSREASDELEYLDFVEPAGASRSGASGSRVNTCSRSRCLARTMSAFSSAVSVLPDADYWVTVTSALRSAAASTWSASAESRSGSPLGSRSRSRRGASSISRRESSCTPIASISTSRATPQAVVAAGFATVPPAQCRLLLGCPLGSRRAHV